MARRFRQAPTAVEARRRQLLALIADRLTVKHAAQLVGLNYDYARRLVHRYNQEGPGALRDRRRAAQPPRPRALLSAAQQQESATALRGPAPSGGRWTVPA